MASTTPNALLDQDHLAARAKAALRKADAAEIARLVEMGFVDANRSGSPLALTEAMWLPRGDIDLEAVRTCLRLLASASDLETRDESQRTLLMLAAATPTLMAPEILELLIPRVDVDAQDADGCTAFFLAIANNCAEAARILLPHCDPRLPDRHSRTPLMQAAGARRPDLLPLLLPVSDANARDAQGRTALMIAAARLRPQNVALLAPFSDFSIRGADGRGVFDIAFAALAQEVDSDPGRQARKLEVLDELAPFISEEEADRATSLLRRLPAGPASLTPEKNLALTPKLFAKSEAFALRRAATDAAPAAGCGDSREPPARAGRVRL